jgi:Tfp pilus assembly protein PilF
VVNLYARHLIAGGEAQMALDYLRGHLRSDDTTAEDCIYLLGLEQYLEREDLLAEDLKWSLERFPDNISLTVFLAYQQADKGDYKGAIKTYKQGIKSATEDKVRSELWGYIGDTYHQMEDSKAAFSAYRKALGFDADNILVLNNYAYFLSLEDRNLEEALQMSARAIALEPNNATYIDTYAWILHRLGRNEEAKQYMRQALSLSSQRDASLLAHYGDILWALGEEFMAETYWQKAVERGYDKDEMETHIQTIKHSER